MRRGDKSVAPAALWAACLLAGCGGSAPPAAAPDGGLSRDAIQRIVMDVQAIRGLYARQPIAIEQLDERSFAEAIDVRQAPALAEGIDRMQAALGLADGGPGSVLQAQRILHEQLLGFYEQGSGKVYLRGGARGGDRDLQRLTLAHEVQHALQDQHFGTLGIKGLLDEDARLARLALLEGDATITGVAYLAAQEGVPLRRAMVRLARTTRLLPTQRVIGDSGPELARAPALERERMVFPYVSGTGFAAELYRAGGFALVDRALARPPDTTEQVLHPARYVAGEAAIPVRAPMPPEGYAAIATGRMGELQTRGLLLPCLGWDRAVRAAEGWGGDAFTVVRSEQGGRAALWSTAWDTEADAAEFEQALSMSTACLPALGGDGADARGQRAPPPARLVRNGTKVVLAMGLSQDRLAPEAATLLSLPEAPLPPAPPVGEAEVRPLPPPLTPRLGGLRGAVYASAWLGLAATVPAGFTAAVGREDAELFLERPGALGVLGLSDRAASAWMQERTFRELSGAFSKGAGVELAVVETASYTLPVGVVTLRRWNVPGTQIEAMAVIAPICEGTGAYIMMLAWARPEDKDGLDQWLLSLRRTTPAPPVCAELNPL
jgi:hypothetical protein